MFTRTTKTLLVLLAVSSTALFGCSGGGSTGAASSGGTGGGGGGGGGTSEPTAAFSAGATSGAAPLPVQFSNLSDAAGQTNVSYFWEFGDGEFSLEKNPNHIYAQPGTYTVTLSVVTDAGDDSVTKRNLIAVVLPNAPEAPIASFSAGILTGDTSAALLGSTVPGVSLEITGGVVPILTSSDSSGNFDVLVSLHTDRKNTVYITAVDSFGQRSAPTVAEIIQDSSAPFLFIDFPEDGAVLTNASISVAGRVGDRLSGFTGLGVRVEGQRADVIIGLGTNGTFERVNVPLALGENTIVASATDNVGNSVTRTITVTREEVSGPQMEVVSGNNQGGQVNVTLPNPIVVRITHEDGTPFANKIATFDVTRSDGRLAGSAVDAEHGALMYQTHTDANGLARAFWLLGSDAGCGNNRITVTSTDISGTTFFCASAAPGPATQINLGSGDNQRGEAGATAAEPLVVWVNDANNGIAGVDVTFTVVEGNGSVGDDLGAAASFTTTTGLTGHARAQFTLGETPGINNVLATFAGNTALPVTFTALGCARDTASAASLSGLVLDNANQPIEGAECMLEIEGETFATVFTNGSGRFRFEDVPAGPAHVRVNGLVATALNGTPIPPGSFPSLGYETVIVPNAENGLAAPVLLPPLDPANAVFFDNTEDVVLTIDGLEGFRMTVKAGSMARADGTVPTADNPAILSLNQVHHDDIPMPMPDGVAPPFAWTLQPSGATFDPPIEIGYPNISALPPGSIAYFLSFDHDAGRFQIVASGSVTDDGAEIVSDPGVGITTAGWGCNCPPYAVTGECDSQGSLIDPALLEAAGVENCYVKVGDVTAPLNPDGSFHVSNITAPDEFGPDGPGSGRDFVSDDTIRAVVYCSGDGGNAYFLSDPFRLVQGETFVVTNLAQSIGPPPELVESIRLNGVPEIVVTGDTVQLQAIAGIVNGTQDDVTATSHGTTYRISNPQTVTVDAFGILTAHAPGLAFVAASHSGATATEPIFVTAGFVTTTIEGVVVTPDGFPAVGAIVTTEFGGSAVTDASGFFSLTVEVLSESKFVELKISFEFNDIMHQRSKLVEIVSGGIADAGIISFQFAERGHEFVLTFQPPYLFDDRVTLSVLISAETVTSGDIAIPGLVVIPFSVIPGTVTKVPIPLEAVILEFDGVQPLGIRVWATEPISVYGQCQFADSEGAILRHFGSFTAYPEASLGLEHYVMSYMEPGLVQFTVPMATQFAVVATEDDTTIIVTPSVDSPTRPAGQPYAVTLNRLDVYQLRGRQEDAPGGFPGPDLTGTHILSNKPVAVFSGADFAVFDPIWDYIVEQVPPVSAWGTDFSTKQLEPSTASTNGDLFRILAAEDDTAVIISGPTPVTFGLGRGEFAEVPLKGVNRIESNKPVMAAQFSLDQTDDGAAEMPTMIIVTPTSRFLNSYTFSTQERTSSLDRDFVNLVVWGEDLRDGLLLLDGEPLNPLLFRRSPGTGFTAATIPIAEGSHTVRAPHPFGLYIYGGTTGRGSYGFSGGYAF